MKKQMQFKMLSSLASKPIKAHPTDAGFDIHAAIKTDITIPKGERHTIDTQVVCVIPSGCVGFLVPRSGLAMRGVTLFNQIGIIDDGYTGELRVVLRNESDGDFVVHPGDRIAQLIVLELPHVFLQEVEELPQTLRGEKGFGSSGGVKHYV